MFFICLPIAAPISTVAQEIAVILDEQPATRQIKANETHHYSFVAVKAGEIFFFQLEKNDLHLKISISDSEQKALRQITLQQFGDEPFSFIAAEAGKYLLTVQSLEKSAVGADYKLHIDSKRAAKKDDYASIEMEQRLTLAEELRLQWSESALREAIKIYAETAAARHRSFSVTVNSFQKAGEIHLILGEFEKSRTAFEQSRAAARTARMKESELRQLCNLAAVDLLTGDYDRASAGLSIVERELRSFPAQSQIDLTATLLNYQGEVDYFKGRLKTSRQFFDRALKQWQILGHRRGEALTRQNLAFLYLDAGELKDAETNLTRSLQLWRDLGDLRGEAIALNAQGNLEALKNRWEAALNLHAQARQTFAFIGDRQSEVVSVNGSGAVYQSLNRPEEAASYYQKALATNLKLGNKGFAAVSYLVLGQVAQSRKKYSEAQEFFEKTIEMCREVNKDRIRLYALDGMAFIKSEAGATAEALRIYRQTFAFYRQIGDLRGQSAVLSSIGDVYAKTGNFSLSEKNYVSAMEVNRQIGDDASVSNLLFKLAKVERERKNFVAALRLIDESIALSESIRAKILSPMLRTAHQTTGRQKYELKLDILMQMRQESPPDALMAQALETLEKSRARLLLEFLSENRVKVQNAVAAEALLEKTELEVRLRKKVEAQLNLRSLATAPPELSEIENEITQLTAEYERLQTKIKSQNHGYDNLTTPRVTSLNEIQYILSGEPDSIYLTYALGERCSYLFLVTPTDVQVFELDGRQKLEAAANEVYHLLIAYQPRKGETRGEYNARVNDADRRYYATAAKLSNQLFGAVAEKIKGKRLLVSLEGTLQYVPLEALPLPSSENVRETVTTGKNDQTDPASFSPLPDVSSYLISQNEIVYLPSFSILSRLRRQDFDKVPTKKLAIWADPVYEENDPRIDRKDPSSANADAAGFSSFQELIFAGAFFPRLLNTGVETKHIEKLVPPEEISIFRDFTANRQQVLTENLADYQILHFATHGIVHDSHPQYSGIMLSRFQQNGEAQDGLLSPEDLLGLELSGTNLVVLSACQTGLGTELSGEGLVGLKYGFLNAGAKSVVVSLWQIDGYATADLMNEFYRNFLKKGFSSSAALREAKMEIARRGNWRSPYYWAAFTLHGEPRIMSDSNASNGSRISLLIGAAVILMLIGGGLFLYREFFHYGKKRNKKCDTRGFESIS